MNVLIVEDEVPAQQQLIRLMDRYFPEFKIVEIKDSISDAVLWLKENRPDLIFMDVELADGNCFEIFKRVNIDSPTIITTAYTDYALNAFSVKCIDYLLKPIEEKAFEESVKRCLSLFKNESTLQKTKSGEMEGMPKKYRERFTIKLGAQILVIESTNISYIYSEDKSSFIVTTDGKHYISDMSIEYFSENLDPLKFFRLTRGCVASIGSIDLISKYFNSRLKVVLKPDKIDPVLVSRARVHEFMDWLEGNYQK